jgi:hypothetical protein
MSLYRLIWFSFMSSFFIGGAWYLKVVSLSPIVVGGASRRDVIW